jgi:glycolate oxidase FAD binding subunit
MLASMPNPVDLSPASAALSLQDLPAQVQPLAAELREWQDRIREARQRRSCLRVQGGGSKDTLGDTSRGELLPTASWQGIEAYEPSELVITARAGTPLAHVEAALAECGQHLPFEPPRLGGMSGSTVGGMVAAGLSGPARAARGAVRDHVLGVRMLNGRAQALRFGGSVMKNVAGFDLSRLMAGSMGTLGVLTEVTLKVLPVPVATATLRFELPQAQAITQVNQWAGMPLPLDASAWWDGLLVLRLRGARAAVAAASEQLLSQTGGQAVPDDLAASFWAGLRDQTDEFFMRARAAVQAGQGRGQAGGVALWRLSVPATSAPLALPGETLIEWSGAQRWLCTSAAPACVHEAAARAGGHALAWLRATPDAVVLPPVLLRLHKQVQQAFDPDGVFDTGRLWPRAGA